ncbi:MAG: hypothetical protein H6Q27_1164 [Ignavibacteriaceae bacterium]|nr:hypothetical protein [Ignavibacteriaceae bacterium]
MQVYNLSAGSKTVLSVLALLALMAFLAVEYGKEDVKLKYYDQKLEASNNNFFSWCF